MATFTPGGGTPVTDSILVTIDTAGARVTASDSGVIADARASFALHFDEAIDPGSFTTADAVLTAPGGAAVPVTSITGGGADFVVHFDSLTEPGVYSIAIGPTLADLAGNAMNQDGDAVGGEVPDDRFVGTLEIAPEADLVVSAITAPTGLVIGNPAQAEVAWTVKNRGRSRRKRPSGRIAWCSASTPSRATPMTSPSATSSTQAPSPAARATAMPGR